MESRQINIEHTNNKTEKYGDGHFLPSKPCLHRTKTLPQTSKYSPKKIKPNKEDVSSGPSVSAECNDGGQISEEENLKISKNSLNRLNVTKNSPETLISFGKNILKSELPEGKHVETFLQKNNPKYQRSNSCSELKSLPIINKKSTSKEKTRVKSQLQKETLGTVPSKDVSKNSVSSSKEKYPVGHKTKDCQKERKSIEKNPYNLQLMKETRASGSRRTESQNLVSPSKKKSLDTNLSEKTFEEVGIPDDVNDFIAQLIDLVSDDDGNDEFTIQNKLTSQYVDYNSVDDIKTEPNGDSKPQSDENVDTLIEVDTSEPNQKCHIGDIPFEVEVDNSHTDERENLFLTACDISHEDKNDTSILKKSISELKNINFEKQPVEVDEVDRKVHNTFENIGENNIFESTCEISKVDSLVDFPGYQSDLDPKQDSIFKQICLTANGNVGKDVSVYDEDSHLKDVCLTETKSTVNEISDSVAREGLTIKQVCLTENTSIVIEDISELVDKKVLNWKNVFSAKNVNTGKCVLDVFADKDKAITKVCSSKKKITEQDILDSAPKEISTLKEVCLSSVNKNCNVSSTSKQECSMKTENPSAPDTSDAVSKKAATHQNTGEGSTVGIALSVNEKLTHNVLDVTIKVGSVVEEIDLVSDDEVIEIAPSQQEYQKEANKEDRIKSPVSSKCQQSIPPSFATYADTAVDKTWISRLPPPPGCEEEIMPEDYFESAFLINILPKYLRNYVVLKGVDQEEIKQFSGASVIVQKKSLELKNRTNITQPVIEETLLIKGKTKSSVFMAERLVQKLISEAQEINSTAAKLFSSSLDETQKRSAPTTLPMKATSFSSVKQTPFPQVDLTKPPPQVLIMPTEFASVNSLSSNVEAEILPTAHWLEEKVFVGLDDVPTHSQFNVSLRLISLSKKEFFKTNGAKITLRGSTNPGASDYKLHLLVRHWDLGRLKSAVEYAHKIVEQVHQEFFEFWTKDRLQVLASAPPKKADALPGRLVTDVQSSLFSASSSDIPLPSGKAPLANVKPPVTNPPTVLLASGALKPQQVAEKNNPLAAKIQITFGTKKKTISSENVLKSGSRHFDASIKNLDYANTKPDISLDQEKDLGLELNPTCGIVTNSLSSLSDEYISKSFQVRQTDVRDMSKTNRSRSRSRDRLARRRDRDARLSNRRSRERECRLMKSRDQRSRSRERHTRFKGLNAERSEERSRLRDRRPQSRDKRPQSRDRRSRERSRSRDRLVTRAVRKPIVQSIVERSKWREAKERYREETYTYKTPSSSKPKLQYLETHSKNKFKSTQKKIRSTIKKLKSKDSLEKKLESDDSSSCDKEQSSRKFQEKNIDIDEENVHQKLLTEVFNYVENVYTAIKEQMNDMLPGGDKHKLEKVCQLFTMLSSFPTLPERLRRLPSVLTLVEKVFKSNSSLFYLIPLLQNVQKIVSGLPSPPYSSKQQSNKADGDFTENLPIFEGRLKKRKAQETKDLTEKVILDEPSYSHQENSQDWLKHSIEVISSKPGSFQILNDAVKIATIGVLNTEPEHANFLTDAVSIDVLPIKSEPSRLIPDAANAKSSEIEHNQTKKLEVQKPRLTPSTVVMQLHEEILQYVETVDGFQKVQLQQILTMLETAPLALVLNDNQRTELKAILLLLSASLKAEIFTGQPKKLLDHMKDLEDILNKPVSLKKPDSCHEVQGKGKIQEPVVATPQPCNLSRPLVVPEDSIKEVNLVKPSSSLQRSSLDWSDSHVDGNKQSDYSATTKSKQPVEGSTIIGLEKSYDHAVNLQEKPTKEQGDVHSKVIEVIKLLQGALMSHLPKIPPGKAKSQLQNVTQMLKFSLENQENDFINERDQLQFTLTMKLLETIIESPDMASSALAQMKPITTQIQYYLANLGAGSLSVGNQNSQVRNTTFSENDCAKDHKPIEPSVEEKPSTTLKDKPTKNTFHHISLIEEQNNDKQTPNTSGSVKDQTMLNIPEQKKSATMKEQPAKNRLRHIIPVTEQPDVKRFKKDETEAAEPTQSMTTSADIFPTLTIAHQNQSYNVVSVPDSSNVFSSLAYIFMEPVKAKTDFAKAVKDIQWKTINFIRANKDIFFLRLSKIYDEDFPGHGLTYDIAFEQCCLYLLYLANSPDNHRWQDIFWCVSLVFNTPIKIMFENSDNNVTVGSSTSTLGKPVELFKKAEGNILPTLKVATFLVATWNLRGGNSVFISSQLVDETLSKNNISVACLQSSWDGVHPGFSTKHFNWNKSYFEVGSEGIVLLVNKTSDIESVQFTTHSSQIATVSCTFRGEVFKIVGCDFSSTENLKDDLTTVAKLLQLADSDQVFILGDFNASITHDNINPNGEILQRFALHFNLKIETAYPPVSKTESLSHILVRANSSPPLSDLKLTHFHLKPFKSHISLSACKMSFIPFELHRSSNQKHCFVSWFVELLHTPEKRNQIELRLLSTNATFACILFTGNPYTDGPLNHEPRFLWFFSGNIAFVLKRNPNLTLQSLKTISERIALAEVKIGTSEFFIVGCILSKIQFKQEISTLLTTVNETPPTARLVVMGEFNADIGFSDLSDAERGLINPTTLNKVHSDSQGKMLKRIALLHDLCFVSTLGNRETPLAQHHTNHILFQNIHHLEDLETTFKKVKRFKNKMITFKFSLSSADI